MQDAAEATNGIVELTALRKSDESIELKGLGIEVIL
jgi:hypothetical protein